MVGAGSSGSSGGPFGWSRWRSDFTTRWTSAVRASAGAARSGARPSTARPSTARPTHARRDVVVTGALLMSARGLVIGWPAASAPGLVLPDAIRGEQVHRLAVGGDADGSLLERKDPRRADRQHRPGQRGLTPGRAAQPQDRLAVEREPGRVGRRQRLYPGLPG